MLTKFVVVSDKDAVVDDRENFFAELVEAFRKGPKVSVPSIVLDLGFLSFAKSCNQQGKVVAALARKPAESLRFARDLTTGKHWTRKKAPASLGQASKPENLPDRHHHGIDKARLLGQACTARRTKHEWIVLLVFLSADVHAAADSGRPQHVLSKGDYPCCFDSKKTETRGEV